MKNQIKFIIKLWVVACGLFLSGWQATYAQTAIASFSPASGPVGTLVTITGSGLSSPTSLTIGGTPAIIVSGTATSVVGMVMPGAVTGNISVTTPGGTATSGANFTVTATPFPAFKQGGKLTGTGASGAAKQGYSVSLSADGNTAIVGGPDDNSNTGAAWIYTRNGNIWTQQGNKLVGTGGVGQSCQGQSVCLSADGNTAIIGGNCDNNNVGAAWIFTRIGNTWTQQGSKLVGTGAIGAWQGWSVSLSADGNTAIVGGPNDNGQVGAAWIYTRSGNIWSQQGSKLVGTGYIGPSYQGWSVSLSADAGTAIIGGYPDNNYEGAAWIFSRSGNTWTQQGEKLVGTGATGKANQGYSVSLSADGNTAIVGGVNDNNFIGAAWVFTRNGTTWTQQGSKLVGTGGIGQSSQGSSVSLSADGNTAVVGGPWDNSNVGAAWVYTRSGNTWTQQGSKLEGTGTTSLIRQGASVSLSATGTTAILGGYMDNGYTGAAWVYIGMPPPGITSFSPKGGPAGTVVTVTGIGLSNPTSFSIGGTPAIVVSGNDTSIVAMIMPGTNNGKISVTTAGGTATSQSNFTVTANPYPSTQQGGKLTGTGVSGSANQGHSISLSADGKTAIVGAPLDNSNVGAAWIYIRSGNTWTQQGSKLVGTGAIGAAKQGNSVSLSADGNTAIVGGYQDNNNAGAAWVFTRSGGIWSQQGSKIVGTGATGNAYQGYSVSLSADGNTALMGGYSDNNDVGAAWVYIRVGTIWTQQGSKLVGTGATGQSWQGSSVSLSADGNTAIVGGPLDNNFVGAAWVYARSGNTWTQQIKLAGTGAVGQTKQGTSVSLSADGNTAIVGGHGDNNNMGAAWVYTRKGTAWTQQGNKLVGNDATTNAFQGHSVSLSADGNTAVVGGYRNNTDAGAAWVYTRIANVWTQCGSKLTGTGASGPSGQGSAVSLSADGTTAIMGGYADNSGVGAAWVFVTPPPVLTSFSPNIGPAGTLVTFTGTGLSFLVSFTIGGIPALVVSNTGTTLVGMVMPGAAIGPASISITTPGGTTTGGTEFFVNPTLYPSEQEGIKLVGTGATGVATQGYSVALSADGNTALVGGPSDNSHIGAAWVYTRSGGIWSQQGSKLVGTGSSEQPQQGCSVALSADGNTAMVGGRSDFYVMTEVGAVWIFTRSGNTWAQQGSKLFGDYWGGTTPHLGHSVSLSADGNTAIVGGPDEGSLTRTGAAWVYSRSGSSWTQQSKLVGTGAIGETKQGSSVSISADGHTAIVGGEGDNSGVGAAWIYTRRENNWIQQGPKLVGTGAFDKSAQGRSVSISADGNTAIVGGFGDNGFIGAAWVFTRTDTTWTQQGDKLVAYDATGTAYQGISVSISADGNTAIVGGQGDNLGAGAAWVYSRRNGIWHQSAGKLTGTGATGQSWQGGSVSLSADGTTAIVGGYSDNKYVGAAWVYKLHQGGVGGGDLTARVSITAEPSGVVSAGTPVTFTATPVNGGTPTYQWMKGKVPIPGETGPTYTSATLRDKDTITVVMTSSLYIAGNPATSNAIIMTFNTTAIGEIGTGSLSDSQKFDVYPVPNNGLFKVAFNSSQRETYSIQVYNTTGVKVYERMEIKGNGLTETNIDLRQASRGIYYVVFRSNHQQMVRKILISTK